MRKGVWLARVYKPCCFCSFVAQLPSTQTDSAPLMLSHSSSSSIAPPPRPVPAKVPPIATRMKIVVSVSARPGLWRLDLSSVSISCVCCLAHTTVSSACIKRAIELYLVGGPVGGAYHSPLWRAPRTHATLCVCVCVCVCVYPFQ